ncbi:MAG: VanZ family protein [Desulfitobacteriaceae bacterium]|nr:VanZ family protein [Desulfitobacteriaceae bacterium]MDD4402244.1 VanZ family protein [Desulfitobacteriaceae bacterium]
MVLLCCSMIFYFTSSSEYTYKETKKTIMKVVKNSEMVDAVNWAIRKLAHVTLFGLLAFLVQRAMQTKKQSYVFAWIFSTCCGIFDEWHQSFHPGRTSLISDVIIDSTAALGILIIVYLYHKGKKMKTY